MSEVEEIHAQSYPDVREEIIQTAIKFLQNHNVINTPLAQKQKFLQRKGLTDQEIQLACERAGAYAHHEMQNKTVLAIPPPPMRAPQSQLIGPFERFKEIIHNLAFISALAYGIYIFYKKIIRPFLFGQKKKKSLEDSVEDLTKSITSSIDELKTTLVSVKVDVDKIKQGEETSAHKQLQDLKMEISTVKGLLLNRKQFPSVSNTPVVPPSIPAWQLASRADSDPADPDTADAKSEDLMEIGSGSGSEHEHGTKTSDSSLEIM